MPSYDKIVKRATFGILYPSNDIKFEESDKGSNYIAKTEEIQGNQKRFVKSKRMTFVVKNSTFRKIIFECSNFHNKHGSETPEIKLISFEDCDFKSTFFGGTIYNRVIFRRCTFNRCDFMNAEFDNCSFDNCSFEDCTAYMTLFNNTEINPLLFYKSIKIPKYNFSSLTPEEQTVIEREWVAVKIHLTRQLVKSSDEVSNYGYLDDSIYLLKCAELNGIIDSIKYTEQVTKDVFGKNLPFIKIWFYKLKFILEWITNGIILISTRGGTSFYRLVFIQFAIISMLSIQLLDRQVKYENIDLNAHSMQDQSLLNQYIHNIPYSLSLFLGFGYGGFKFEHKEVFFLTTYTVLGLIWYTMLGTVIIRKIYK